MSFFLKKLIIVELHYFEKCKGVNIFSQGNCRRVSEKKSTK